MRPVVRGASELLGIDPLYVACEGRLVAVVDGGQADAGAGRAAVATRSARTPRSSARSRADPPGLVLLQDGVRRAPGSSTCWSATRCRGSADGGPGARTGDHRERGAGGDGAAARHGRSPACTWRSARMSGVVAGLGAVLLRAGDRGHHAGGGPAGDQPSRRARCRCRDCGARVRARTGRSRCATAAAPTSSRPGRPGTADHDRWRWRDMCATCGCGDEAGVRVFGPGHLGPGDEPAHQHEHTRTSTASDPHEHGTGTSTSTVRPAGPSSSSRRSWPRTTAWPRTTGPGSPPAASSRST